MKTAAAMRFFGFSLAFLLFVTSAWARDDDRRVSELTEITSTELDEVNDYFIVWDSSSGKAYKITVYNGRASLGTKTGAGVTRFYGDTGIAVFFDDGTASSIFIVGENGVTVEGSGNTLYVRPDGIEISGVSILWNSGVTLPFLATVTSDVQAQLSALSSDVGGKADLNAGAQFDYVNAGVSVFFVYSGVTLDEDMLAGGMLYCHASSPVVIGIPAITGSTPYFMIKDMTGSGVTVQTTDGETLYDGDDSGTAIWVDAGHHRHQVSINLLSESGTCKYADTIGKSGDHWNVD